MKTLVLVASAFLFITPALVLAQSQDTGGPINAPTPPSPPVTPPANVNTGTLTNPNPTPQVNPNPQPQLNPNPPAQQNPNGSSIPVSPINSTQAQGIDFVSPSAPTPATSGGNPAVTPAPNATVVPAPNAQVVPAPNASVVPAPNGHLVPPPNEVAHPGGNVVGPGTPGLAGTPGGALPANAARSPK